MRSGAASDNWVDRLNRRIIEEEQLARLREKRLEERRQCRGRLEEIEEGTARSSALELTVTEVEKVLADSASTWDATSRGERREVMRPLTEYLKMSGRRQAGAAVHVGGVAGVGACA